MDLRNAGAGAFLQPSNIFFQTKCSNTQGRLTKVKMSFSAASDATWPWQPPPPLDEHDGSVSWLHGGQFQRLDQTGSFCPTVDRTFLDFAVLALFNKIRDGAHQDFPPTIYLLDLSNCSECKIELAFLLRPCLGRNLGCGNDSCLITFDLRGSGCGGGGSGNCEGQ